MGKQWNLGIEEGGTSRKQSLHTGRADAAHHHDNLEDEIEDGEQAQVVWRTVPAPKQYAQATSQGVSLFGC